MLIDTHCHLDPQTYGGPDGVDAAVARAQAAGVTRLVHIACSPDPAAYARAAELARRHPGVRFTAGVHPHDAKEWTDEVADAIRAAAADPAMVAVGEMGLDFHYDLSNRDVQRAVLRVQIALARELNKPIVIHDRESDGETLRILDEERAFDVPVLYHCFTGDRAHMAEIVARGGYISIPGIVTFKTATEMQAVAAVVPDDRLLVETDSPYLTPIPFRGKKNEPAYVRLVAERVAAIRGISVEELGEKVMANAERLFGG